MLRVAHLRDTFLRSTETFIYDIYTRHRSVEGYFFCERTANRDQFPADRVFSMDGLSKTQRFQQRLLCRLAGGFPFYRERAKALGIGLLHAHFGPTGYYCLPAKRTLGIPLLTSFYGQDLFEVPAKRRWARRYRRLFEEGEFFLALSRDMEKDLLELGCPPEKIRVYRLGIDLSDFSPRERTCGEFVRILCVARLVEKKGIEYLLRATRVLVEKGFALRLKIIGDGPLMDTLRDLALSLNLGETVAFAGRLPFSALPEEMAGADIFCLPSVRDRFGGKDEVSMVLKEAMGTAMPVVATVHAGIPEVIEDGESGLLVPERDVAALAGALESLAGSRENRSKIGMAGRRLVERVWEIHRQVDELESIYTELARA